jgi:UDP-N-acetylmuramoylalanine--D-glutamate ligase
VHVEIFGELATRLAGDLTGTSTEHGPRPFAVAVHAACAQLAPQSVLLFSPGAPSFDEFENWQARSAAFREIIAAWA